MKEIKTQETIMDGETILLVNIKALKQHFDDDAFEEFVKQVNEIKDDPFKLAQLSQMMIRDGRIDKNIVQLGMGALMIYLSDNQGE